MVMKIFHMLEDGIKNQDFDLLEEGESRLPFGARVLQEEAQKFSPDYIPLKLWYLIPVFKGYKKVVVEAALLLKRWDRESTIRGIEIFDMSEIKEVLAEDYKETQGHLFVNEYVEMESKRIEKEIWIRLYDNLTLKVS